MERFVSWFLANGGRISSSAEILVDDREQYHMRVRLGQTVLEGETLVSCPQALTFNYASFIHDNTQTKATQLDVRSLAQDIALRLFLMEQYLLGKDSFWWPYISILPQPCQRPATDETANALAPGAVPQKNFHTPLYFGEEDMLWLTGTNLGVATRQRAADWEEEFEAAKDAINGIEKHKQDLWTRFALLWSGPTYRQILTLCQAICISGRPLS